VFARRYERLSVARYFPAVFLCSIILAILPSSFVMAERFVRSQIHEDRRYAVLPGWYTYPNLEIVKTRALEQLSLVSAWRRLMEHVPPGECIYHIKPAPMMLYVDRRIYLTPISKVTRSEQYLSEATQCRYFYVGAYVYAPYREAFYPAKDIGPNARILTTDYLEGDKERRVVGMLLEVAPSGLR
jgi:hypothetical protein